MPRLPSLAFAFFAAAAQAQIPDGHVVVASMQDPTSSFYTGLGGLHFSHPRNPGLFDTIANLPPALTGANTPGQTAGARSVLVLPDGDLLVGTRQPSGVGVEIHRLRLSGSTVAASTALPLGTAAPGGGGVVQMALRSPTQVLAVGNHVPGLPTIGAAMYAIDVDLVTGIITHALPAWTYPGTGTSPLVQGVACDPATQSVYLLIRTGPSNGPYTSEVWSFTPIAPAPALPVASVQGAGLNLAWSNAGCLYLALDIGNPVNPSLWRYTPGRPMQSLLTGWDFVQAVAVEPTTGHLILCGMQSGSQPATGGVHWFDLTSNTATQLANGLRSGLPRAPFLSVAAAPDPVAFGAPSGPLPDYLWSGAQDPNRLPMPGNAAFSVEVAWPNGSSPVLGLCAIGIQPLIPPLRVAGVDLHVSPVAMWLVIMTSDLPGRRSVLSLPLPANLPPGAFYLQAFHFVGPTLAIHASEGLRVSIL